MVIKTFAQNKDVEVKFGFKDDEDEMIGLMMFNAKYGTEQMTLIISKQHPIILETLILSNPNSMGFDKCLATEDGYIFTNYVLSKNGDVL